MRTPCPSRARIARGVLLATVASWPLAASAYRPFDSTDAAVADRGTIELELGPLGWLAQGPERSFVASAVVNWGFAERWEAVLEGRHLVGLGRELRGPRLRVEDTALSVKRVLRAGSLQGRAGPSVATEVGALLPTIHGEAGVGAQGTLVLSQRWTTLTVHLNVEAAWTRAHAPGAFGGIVLEAHDAWAVRPVAEAFVDAERGTRPALSGLVGAIGRIREGLSWDVGLRRARAGDVRTTELRIGLTWSFEVQRAPARRGVG